MIDFECPKCGEQISVPGSLAGQSETCPKRGTVARVPASKEAGESLHGFRRTVPALERFRRWALPALARNWRTLTIAAWMLLVLWLVWSTNRLVSPEKPFVGRIVVPVP